VPQDLWAGVPQSLTAEDLIKSDCIVLMDETEHRPMLEKQFPVRDDRKIHYWHIGESGRMKPSQACQEMSGDVGELLRTLARLPSSQ
jgi:protein-tyrosine-phosphatase